MTDLVLARVLAGVLVIALLMIIVSLALRLVAVREEAIETLLALRLLQLVVIADLPRLARLEMAEGIRDLWVRLDVPRRRHVLELSALHEHHLEQVAGLHLLDPVVRPPGVLNPYTRHTDSTLED